jgi:hypothetical protein
MIPEVVSFASLAGRYQISPFRCNDIACTCTDVAFKLKQIRKRKKGERPREILIRVDVPTWKEKSPPERSPEEAELVAEFLRDYPEAERNRLGDWYRERDRIMRRLNECRLDPAEVAGGLLVSFREILAPPDDPFWHCPLGETRFEDGDEQYLVSEHYCLNPACECNQLHLVFHPIRPDPEAPGKYVAETAFRATMSLDGRVELERLDNADPATARRIVAEWEEDTDRAELKKLKWRYERMREIGRRSMEGYIPERLAEPARPRLDLAQPDPTPKRVGRNDPCPCGSGKKYKRCCARSSEAALF